MSRLFTLKAGSLALIAALAVIATPSQAVQDRQDQDPDAPKELKNSPELIREIVDLLVKVQKKGAWPYKGVIGQPIGMEVGGTSIAASAMLHCVYGNKAVAKDNEEARSAISAALDYVLKALQEPKMAVSVVEAYDVRVWGQMGAIEFLCHAKRYKACGEREQDVDDAIKKLVDILVTEQLKDGGWNYATRRSHAPFCTAYVVQGLLYAQGLGYKIPNKVFINARKAIESSRYNDTLGYAYGGKAGAKDNGTVLPGSISRTVSGESTLMLLGTGDMDKIRKSIEYFHKYWANIEKYRGMGGTHRAPYGVAPYYFYYGHRYCAQAIQHLPAEERAAERTKLEEKLLREKIRNKNGLWNDREWDICQGFGTGMTLAVFLGENQPMPPRWVPEKEDEDSDK